MQILTFVDMNKNELQNVIVQNLASPPSAPKTGQIYYNTTDKLLYQYNGFKWVPVGAPYNLPVATGDKLGGIKVGAGLSINSDTGVLSATGGGVADSVDWQNITSKPFDEINSSEMEITGAVGAKKLGIKKIAISKINGLNNALASKLSEIKKNNVTIPSDQGVVNIEVPIKNSDLENDSKFITSVEAPVQSVNGDTGVVSVSTASIGAVPTDRTINAKPLTDNIVLNADDVSALPKAGGVMSGGIDMGTHKITNVTKGTSDGDAVNKGQLDEAIAGIGTVFNLKGSKPNFEALPKDSNKVGDVWFVEDESVGYIWIEKDGILSWEKFGPSIDLSGYLTKDNLLQETGIDTKNTMSQNAISEALKLKADESKVNKIPVVKTKSDNITSEKTSVAIAFTGTFITAFAKNAVGEEVLTDIKIESTKVTFSIASSPNSNIVCTVVYA